MEGSAKLADFGIATGAGLGVVARAGDVAGTPGYVAPEVLSGATPTPQADLYSLGVVTYRLLTGPTLNGRGDAAATSAMATAAPQLPPLAEVRPELPLAMAGAIHKAIARRPCGRQRSVAEFRAELIDAALA